MLWGRCAHEHSQRRPKGGAGRNAPNPKGLIEGHGEAVHEPVPEPRRHWPALRGRLGIVPVVLMLATTATCGQRPAVKAAAANASDPKIAPLMRVRA